MIQIQIATRLTEHGLGDIRWVLLDPDEEAPPPGLPATPADGDRPAAAPAGEDETNGALAAAAARPDAPAGAAQPPRWARHWPAALALCAILAAAGWVAYGGWERSGAAPTGAASTGAHG